jgi:hypothetical protein
MFIPDPDFPVPDPGSKRHRTAREKLQLSHWRVRRGTRERDNYKINRYRTVFIWIFPSRIPDKKRHRIADPDSQKKNFGEGGIPLVKLQLTQWRERYKRKIILKYRTVSRVRDVCPGFSFPDPGSKRHRTARETSAFALA